MELTKEQKYQIEAQIVETVLNALDKDLLMTDQLQEIADYALEGMKKVSNEQDLLNFLSSLSSKWKIFEGLAVLQKGKIVKKEEKEVADGILMLIKEGKIDDALNLAKSATN